ncbi:MAG: PIN domain-containing protein [Promethearchaeota archaeon]
MRRISLDTGPISRFLAKDKHPRLEKLFESIRKHEIQAFLVSPVLAEVYKHLCVKKGKIYAEKTILTFLDLYEIQIELPNKNLAIKAGELKCSHRANLSYTDCFVLAFALFQKLEVHTTEKHLPSFQKLKIVTYKF